MIVSGALTGVLGSLLFGVKVADPLTFAGVAVIPALIDLGSIW